MVKNVKRLASGLLAGLMFFTSISANAWEEVSPVIKAKSDIGNCEDVEFNSNFFYQYDPVTRDDGFLIRFLKIPFHPINTINLVAKGIFGKGFPAVMDEEYFESLCRYKNIEREKFTNVSIPFFYGDKRTYLKKLSFPKLSFVSLYGFLDKETNKEIITSPAMISYKAFSDCTNLRIIYMSGPFDFVDEKGDKTNKTNIDLFPACSHSVLIICETKNQIDKFKYIMGSKGAKHKMILFSELNKYKIADDKPTRYTFSDSKLSELSSITIKTNETKSKNILIPKDVTKIEKDVFRKSDLVAVTFEEGMKEIEFCDGCFADCKDLIKFELPKSLKKIVLGKECFNGCPNAHAIEEYILGEQRRIQNEEAEERKRKEIEEAERKKREEAEERDRLAKELEKWKNQTLEKINECKKKLEENIKKLEKDESDKTIERNVRIKDLDDKIKEKPASMNEIEQKLFNAEKEVLEAKVVIAGKDLELVEVKLKGKKELLESYDEHIETLKNAKKIDNLFIENIKVSQEAQHDKEEAEKMLMEAKKNLDILEKVRGEIAQQKDEIERRVRESEKREEENFKETERLRKEREAIEKEKGFFFNLKKKMTSVNPATDVVKRVTKKMGSKVVLCCKIGAGIVVAGVIATAVMPILKVCMMVKKFFTNKFKKLEYQKN